MGVGFQSQRGRLQAPRSYSKPNIYKCVYSSVYMKIYKIEQDKNSGYDTYSDCVVIAENEEEARNMNPSGEWKDKYTGWAHKPEQVTVEYIGEAKECSEKGFVCTSYHAG